MSLLTELDAFYLDHRRCPELKTGVDGPTVWDRLRRGAGPSAVLRTANDLTSTLESLHHPGMERRHFLLTSQAGALAAPLAVEAQCPGRLLLPLVLPPRR